MNGPAVWPSSSAARTPRAIVEEAASILGSLGVRAKGRAPDWNFLVLPTRGGQYAWAFRAVEAFWVKLFPRDRSRSKRGLALGVIRKAFDVMLKDAAQVAAFDTAHRLGGLRAASTFIATLGGEPDVVVSKEESIRRAVEGRRRAAVGRALNAVAKVSEWARKIERAEAALKRAKKAKKAWEAKVERARARGYLA
jgi:hypothetical protein